MAADASIQFPSNIPGAYYASKVVDLALFREVVLIMDCCRDLKLNFDYEYPAINQAPAGAAPAVKILKIFAAKKALKAQERPIPERGGRVHGLLTHALFKALKEARPDNGTLISSTAIKQYLLNNWKAICGSQPADDPAIATPESGDIFFPAGNKGTAQAFLLTQPIAQTLTIEILDYSFTKIGDCTLNANGSGSLTLGGDMPVPLTVTDGSFVLQLQPGLYKFLWSGDRVGEKVFQARGMEHVEI